MKKNSNNKGITLIILIIYITLTMIILGTVSLLTVYFRENLNKVNERTEQDTEFDKLNVQLLQETKIEGNLIDVSESTETEIVFTNGNTYTYSAEDKAIYLNNNIKIANNVDNSFKFTIAEIAGKQKLTVTVSVLDKERTLSYYITPST